jgi:hypothetical protein
VRDVKGAGSYVWICVILCVLSAVICGGCGYYLNLIGAFLVTRDEKVLLDKKWIGRVMEKHAEFRGLEVREDSAGFVYLKGELPSERSKQELRRLLTEQGGEEWADARLRNAVSVAPGPGAGAVPKPNGGTAEGDENGVRGVEKGE